MKARGRSTKKTFVCATLFSLHLLIIVNYCTFLVSFSFPSLLPPTDERQDVQQKTFTKWINHHLNKGGHEPIKNLFEDLRDGHKLLALLEMLTHQKYVS
jgi:Calponin homology (CH) domain